MRVDSVETNTETRSAEQNDSSRAFISELFSQASPTTVHENQRVPSEHLAKSGLIPQLQSENRSDAALEVKRKRDNNTDDAKRPNPELVTGNGYGYAMLSAKGELTKFLAHPYAYERAGKDPKDSGVETLNFNSKTLF